MDEVSVAYPLDDDVAVKVEAQKLENKLVERCFNRCVTAFPSKYCVLIITHVNVLLAAANL
jgi:hypothetical protein